MSSAGRLQAAVHAGSEKGAQLVRHMGWYITESSYNPEANQPVVDGVDYTTQNPRMFTVKNALDVLDNRMQDMKDKGEPADTEAALINFLTGVLNMTDAPKYADTLAKLSNMVLDYGMGLVGSTDAMVRNFNDLVQEVHVDFNKPGNQLDPFSNPSLLLDQNLKALDVGMPDVAETLFDVFSKSLLEVANLGYSQALSKTFTAGAMLNIPAVFSGYDGNKFPVGKVGRPTIYSEKKVLIQGKKGSVEADVLGPVQDLPAAPAESKFIEAEETFSEPLPYSAVAQAISPAIGHVTERSLIVDAYNRMKESLGKQDDIILDIHDAIGMSPLESIVFQRILNTKSTKDVLSFDLPRKTSSDMFDEIYRRLGAIIRQDDMVLGPDSDYSELTDWFDGQFKRLIDQNTELSKFKDPKALKRYRSRMIRTARMLQRAQDFKLWEPKESIRVLDIPFRTGPKATQASFSVDPKNFVKWYADNILKDAKDASSKNITDFGSDLQNLVEDMANVPTGKASFMKSGT